MEYLSHSIPLCHTLSMRFCGILLGFRGICVFHLCIGRFTLFHCFRRCLFVSIFLLHFCLGNGRERLFIIRHRLLHHHSICGFLFIFGIVDSLKQIASRFNIRFLFLLFRLLFCVAPFLSPFIYFFQITSRIGDRVITITMSIRFRA